MILLYLALVEKRDTVLMQFIRKLLFNQLLVYFIKYQLVFLLALNIL